MAELLAGKTIAVRATDGVEQVELTDPVKALRGVTIPVGSSLNEADPKDFDGLVLPGGVINPDALRLVAQAIAFVRHFADAKKSVAAICHGPWTLIDAGGVNGKRMTSCRP
jgi:protease I